VQSEPGRGSRFSVMVPIRKESARGGVTETMA